METTEKDYEVVRLGSEVAPQCEAGDVVDIQWQDRDKSRLVGEVISNDGEYIELLMNDPNKDLG